MHEIPLKQVIEASLENIKKVLDADTVVGTPISLPNDVTIIPVSKISCVLLRAVLILTVNTIPSVTFLILVAPTVQVFP